jgi:hypothetical protein
MLSWVPFSLSPIPAALLMSNARVVGTSGPITSNFAGLKFTSGEWCDLP